MQRRRFLAASAALGAAAVLGGCGGDAGGGATPTRTDTGTTTTPGFRTVTAGRMDDGGLPEIDLRPSFSVLDGTITAGSPARVRLTVENTTADERTVYYRRCPPADKHVGNNLQAQRKRLYLLNASEWTTERSDAALAVCWRPETFDIRVEQPCRTTPVTVPGGDEHVREFEVWDHPGNGPCFPPGPYRFTETWRGTEDGEQRQWRFDLLVKP